MTPDSRTSDTSRGQRRMTRIVLIAGAVLAVLVLVALLLPFVIPAERYKDIVLTQAREALGRDVRVEGPVSLSILPRIAIDLNDLVVEGRKAQNAPDLLQVEEAEAVVALWPLLHGEVQVERFVLTKPVVRLEVAADGTNNWTFQKQSPQQAKGEAPHTESQRETHGLSVADFAVSDGHVVYTNAKNGAAYEAQDVDLKFSLPSLDQAADLKGEATFRGQRVQVNATVAVPRNLMEQGETAVQATLDAVGASARFDGTIHNKAEGFEGAGAFNLNAPETARLATWAAGHEMQLPFRQAQVSANVDASAQRIVLDALQVTADDLKVQGKLDASLGGARPKLAGTLDVSRLNLDNLLPPQSQQAAPATGQAGQNAAKGWSREPIDLSALKAFDADLTLNMAGVIMRGVEAGPTRMTVKLSNGDMQTRLAETAVFGGMVQADLRLNASGRVPEAALNATAQGVQMETALTVLADFRKLAGTGQVQANLHTAGDSIFTMMQGLNGNGDFKVTDGAIKGINIAAMARNIGSAFQTGSEAQETDFAELSGTFTIQNGQARNDLQLSAPLLRLTGQGQVGLPERTLNYRLVPTLAATLKGQGGEAQKAGLTVPILVSGTFDNIHFAPDLAGAAEQFARNPDAAVEQLKGLKEGVRSGDLLKGLLGR